MSLVSALLGWFFLQSYVKIPNAYELDVDRDPPRYAAPCDRDNLVSVNLPSQRYLVGGVIQMRLDSEDRYMGHGSDSVMLRAKWEF